jgi:hypothetical protein
MAKKSSYIPHNPLMHGPKPSKKKMAIPDKPDTPAEQKLEKKMGMC